LGEVYRPEDVSRKKKREAPDLGPNPIRKPTTPASIDDLIRELGVLRADVEKIKRALKTRGILIQ
jgi:hypothetical protein